MYIVGCAHLCVLMFYCGATCVCDCTWVWRPKLTLVFHLTYQVRQVLLLNSEFVFLASLACQFAQSIPCLLFPHSGITGRPSCPPGIYMGSEDLNFSLHTWMTRLSLQSHLLQPCVSFPKHSLWWQLLKNFEHYYSVHCVETILVVILGFLFILNVIYCVHDNV